VNLYDVNDPSKLVGKQVVKVEPNSYKHGTWTYYNPQMGTVEKTESWVMDKPKIKENITDDLAPIDVTDGDGKKKADTKVATKPKEVLEFEKKNAGKKKVKVRTGSTGG
jgi:ABC-type antimicrobial peptide transport system ATPase subunit